MTISDALVIVAVLLAPLTALTIQRYLDRRRAKNDRRIELFRTLMGTRGAKLSPAHVHALNMIDIEFYGVKRVTHAWKEYLDHLNTPSGDGQALEVWMHRSDDFLVNLLYEISVVLRYDFDKPHLRRAIYVPKAFGDEEAFQRGMRLALAQLFTGNYALPVRLVGEAPAPTGAEAPPDGESSLPQTQPPTKAES